MEEGSEPTEKGTNLEGEVRTALQAASSKLPSNDFVKVEKNLASLGFFTPSSKRTRNEKAKTVAVTVVIDGKRIGARATIAPTALFGLPITADQDKWLALNKILEDIQARDGQVTNPVCFSSAELLALLKIYKNSGKNYRDVGDWLDVMVGTTIVSEGAVYFAGKKTFGKDTFHVFDRAVSFGKQMPDGSIADKNYVWLSQWQLQNINDHHQLPIDLDTYRQLRNHIAKALVPLLQVWLYATRTDGVFEKRYAELCQILDIRQWTYPSKIKEKLGPSLDELKNFGYLADWRIETTSDKQGYKVLLFHGEKFHSDQRARQSRKQLSNRSPDSLLETGRHRGSINHADREQPPRVNTIFTTTPAPQHVDPVLVSEFTRRGITEKKAFELLANLKPGQDRKLIAQLEYADETIRQLQGTPNPVRNPAGFIISFIGNNSTVPDNFETIAQRTARVERERKERARRDAEEARQELEWAYDNYCETEIDRYIAANAAAFEALKNTKWEEDRAARFTFATESMARISAKNEVRKQITFLTFEEFLEHKKQGTALFLKPVGPSPAAEPTTESDGLGDLLAAEERREAAMNEMEIGTTEPATAPELPPSTEAVIQEPMIIELVSDPPEDELGTSSRQQEAA